MDFKLLRYFVVLAEELHFARAAARLHIAQPSLSIQIREMERRLGGKLFERTKRTVRLTTAGEQFLIDARDVLERADYAERRIGGLLRGEIGRIDMGFSSIAAYSGLLRRTVRIIRSIAPALEIVLHELEPRAQVEALEARQIDIALTPTLAVRLPAEIEGTRLDDWPLELAIAADHPLVAQASIGIEDVLDQPFIAYASPLFPMPPQVYEEVLGRAPAIWQSAQSASLALAMIGAGLGVSLLPRALVDLGRMNHVEFRPIKEIAARVDCSLLMRRDAHNPVMPKIVGTLRQKLCNQ